MNPLFTQWAGVIVRMILTTGGASMVSTWLVEKGFLTVEQLDHATTGAVVLLAALGWSLWQKYRGKLILFTGLAMPKGTTLDEVKKAVAAGVSAPAGTGTCETPALSKSVDSIKPRAWLLPLLLASSLAAGAGGCAAGPRAKLVLTHQSLQTAFATMDDAERLLCWDSLVAPADGTRCTTEAARLAGLTTERHKEITRGLIKAFEAQLALGKVIAVWTPGAPVDFALIDKAAAEIDTQVKLMNLSLPSLQPLIQSIREWSVEIEKLKQLFGR